MTSMDIEAALTWAYRTMVGEAGSVGPASERSSLARVIEILELGTIVDRSARVIEPRETQTDEIRAGAARDLVAIAEHVAAAWSGRTADMDVMVPRLIGWRADAIAPIAIERLRVVPDMRVMVRRLALLGERPRLETAPAVLPGFRPSLGFGRAGGISTGIMVDETAPDRRLRMRRRSGSVSATPVEAVDPVAVLQDRLVWTVWHAVLSGIVERAREAGLRGVVVTGPALPIAPWQVRGSAVEAWLRGLAPTARERGLTG